MHLSRRKAPFAIVLTSTMERLNVRSMSQDLILIDEVQVSMDHSPNLEENIVNVVIGRPESSTKAVVHHVCVSHQTICSVLNKSLLHPLSFLASTSFEFRCDYPLHLNFC
ncbi:hypothetical protein TNCV_4129491 [Trichonephila clavipes]|nr:hypothetical protein TNCV_4129491 [Trichonephila clavipes]